MRAAVGLFALAGLGWLWSLGAEAELEGPAFDPAAVEVSIDSPAGALSIRGLPAALLDLENASDQLRIVPVESPDEELLALPSMLGTFIRRGERLIFQPRYPLAEGLEYRILLVDPDRPDSIIAGWSVSTPSGRQSPRARVAAVHPSASVLPENQLKFYIEFTHPMRRWDPFSHISLIDEDTGEEAQNVFLEANAELWDPVGTRFTLLFDPGRIKRGLQNNLAMGPPLREGGRYRLVVSSAWPDGRGVPMNAGFEKRFTVGPADRRMPDPDTWRLTVPSAASGDPLVVSFGEPMDHAYLEHALWITDGSGEAIDGEAAASRDDTSWSFRPRHGWVRGDYSLAIDSRLEDQAGNNLNRLFDMDLENGEGLRETPIHVLRFTIR